jgi:hypothetical protein
MPITARLRQLSVTESSVTLPSKCSEAPCHQLIPIHSIVAPKLESWLAPNAARPCGSPALNPPRPAWICRPSNARSATRVSVSRSWSDEILRSRMPRYVFRIHQGSYSSDLPDDDAAWHEAARVCSDLVRGSILRLRGSPEGRLEVVDEVGTVRHLFRLTAETFDP